MVGRLTGILNRSPLRDRLVLDVDTALVGTPGEALFSPDGMYRYGLTRT